MQTQDRPQLHQQPQLVHRFEAAQKLLAENDITLVPNIAQRQCAEILGSTHAFDFTPIAVEDLIAEMIIRIGKSEPIVLVAECATAPSISSKEEMQKTYDQTYRESAHNPIKGYQLDVAKLVSGDQLDGESSVVFNAFVTHTHKEHSGSMHNLFLENRLKVLKRFSGLRSAGYQIRLLIEEAPPVSHFEILRHWELGSTGEFETIGQKRVHDAMSLSVKWYESLFRSMDTRDLALVDLISKDAATAAPNTRYFITRGKMHAPMINEALTYCGLNASSGSYIERNMFGTQFGIGLSSVDLPLEDLSDPQLFRLFKMEKVGNILNAVSRREIGERGLVELTHRIMALDDEILDGLLEASFKPGQIDETVVDRCLNFLRGSSRSELLKFSQALRNHLF